MSKQKQKIDHLARLGLDAHTDKTLGKDGTLRTDVEILGRRSRKVWSCAATDECSVGLDIDVDEVYIQHSVGVAIFAKTNRYHIACALNKRIVAPVENSIDKGNSRRAAIHAQRARKAASA